MMLKPEHISAYSLIIEEGTPFMSGLESRRANKAAWYAGNLTQTEAARFRHRKPLLR